MSETMIRKNHMDVLWHEYTDKEGQNLPVVQASLTEKASIIGIFMPEHIHMIFSYHSFTHFNIPSY